MTVQYEMAFDHILPSLYYYHSSLFIFVFTSN